MLDDLPSKLGLADRHPVPPDVSGGTTEVIKHLYQLIVLSLSSSEGEHDPSPRGNRERDDREGTPPRYTA